MKPEAKLWAKLSDYAKWRQDLYVERIENKIGAGMPDVLYHLPEYGKRGFIELKVQTGKSLPHYTRAQRAWIKSRGDMSPGVFLLVKYIDTLYLYTHRQANKLKGVKPGVESGALWTGQGFGPFFVQALVMG